MQNFTFQDLTAYYTPRLAEQKADKREDLMSKISEKQSKIGTKNTKIQELLEVITECQNRILEIESEIAELPLNKQFKAVGKRSKIDTKREKITEKQARILEIQEQTIPAILKEIKELQTEIKNLDKHYEAKLQNYIDNFGTIQSAVINNIWYKIPYGTSVQMIGLTHFFYYLGKEIILEPSTKEECEELQLTNVINSSNVYSNSNISMSNVSIDGGIFIGNINQS
jgi:hypothetical protein